jgi:hypothetical protein
VVGLNAIVVGSPVPPGDTVISDVGKSAKAKEVIMFAGTDVYIVEIQV